jgi:ferredoxin
MTVKVEVNTEGCISCGACVAICDKVFEFNDANKTIVKRQPLTEEEIKCAKESMNACPVMVINVEEIKASNNADYESSKEEKSA